MKKFILGDKEYWAGLHSAIGIVVFDRVSQEEVDDDKVRLWLAPKNRMGTFLKNLVRELILPDGNDPSEDIGEYKRAIQEYSRHITEEEIGAAVRDYHNLRMRMIRYTHCWNCKDHLNSKDFALCEKCGWILCDCGGCGCGYQKG